MANPEHLKWLREGVESWNRRREEDPFVPDLSGADLTRANLKGANLSKSRLERADLSKANLAWADLREAKLYRADLMSANLRGADLTVAKLEKADLTSADLKEAKLEKADLRGADLTRAQLRGAQLEKADLSGADLSKANLAWADLREAKLYRANLMSADLSEAKLYRVDLMSADLRRADLRGAYLTVANLEGALLREANLRNADLAWADLAWADLRSADLKEANVRTVRGDSDDIRTDLSGAIQFTQKQLNTMDGDTGVLLPEDLVHPEHWSEWSPSREDIISQLAATGPRSAILAGEKIDVTDTPPGGIPEVNDPSELQKIFEEIARHCESLPGLWGEYSPQTNRMVLTTTNSALLSAREKDENWYTWERLIELLQRRRDDDDKGAWRGFDDELTVLIMTIRKLRKFLEKFSDAKTPKPQAPEIRISESDIDIMRQLSIQIEQLVLDPNTQDILTDRAIEEIDKDNRDIAEGLEKADNPNIKTREKSLPIWRSALKSIGGYIASISKSVLPKVLTDSEAAETLKDHAEALKDSIEKILDTILKFLGGS
ncbi:pentapeptide repeat-containing protein [Roseibium sp.]|uniref:pentapeptide repeat-containing protein n=1 Tax=Roseibium sp. TaxID=1936156 RepID=UPI003BAD222C